MRRPLLALALSLSLYGTATAAPIISTLPGDPTTATGITGLEIPGMPGVVYDVDFTHADESFNAIFGVGDPPSGMVPTFYDYKAGAKEMRDAIVLALDGSPGVTSVGGGSRQSVWLYVPHKALFGLDPDTFVWVYYWGFEDIGGGQLLVAWR